MKLGIIGCGNMASAIVRGLVNSGQINNIQLKIFDIDIIKKNALAALHTNISAVDNLQQLFENGKYILIAVKPQNFNDLFIQITGLLSNDNILISIAAGISSAKINTLIKNNRKTVLNIPVCRIMPNLPAFVFKGMSGIYFDKNFSETDKTEVKNLFAAIGELIIVTDENKINAVTAVSGSGPGYFYFFAECLIAAAQEIGFNKEDAVKLVYTTLDGSLKYMLESEHSPEQLRAQVTSPGGTTEAAIKTFIKNNFKESIISSVKAARDRASELGK